MKKLKPVEGQTPKGLDTINKPVLLISGITCLVVIALTLSFPEQSGALISAAFDTMTSDFAWFYILIVLACCVFVYYVAFSKYGKIKLGADDDVPEHSFGQWFFMLFTAGMGVGLLFYSVAEPMSIFLDPPTGEGSTAAAAQQALRLSFLHWGIYPWVCYAAIGGAMAYFTHRIHKPTLMSSVYIPLVGEDHAKGIFGKVLDSLAIVVTVFGITTSLGLGAMQVSGGLAYQFGFDGGTTLMVAIIFMCTVIFIIASIIGLDKAISICSNVNIWVMIALTAIILVIGNTPFLINYFTESIGGYVANLINESFFVDVFGVTDGWVGAWTIFFWAWWIAWIPFTGGFIARISRGRTLRQFILGVTLCPCLFSFVFLTVFGGSAIDLTLNQGVTQIAEAVQESTALGLFATLQQFPLSVVTVCLIMVLLLIFFVAHLQVGSVVICDMLTKRGVTNSPLIIKIFWGCVLGTIAAALLLAGGLTSIQTISIIGALPFGVAVLGGIVSFAKALKLEYEPGTGRKRTQAEVLELYETDELELAGETMPVPVPEGAEA